MTEFPTTSARSLVSSVLVHSHALHPELFHKDRLTNLVQDLRLIGEQPHYVRYMIVEPFWRPDNSPDQIVRMPDLIVVRRSSSGRSALVAELKHSERSAENAMEQLANGIAFVNHELGIRECDAKLVFYHDNGDYTYQRIKPVMLRRAYAGR